MPNVGVPVRAGSTLRVIPPAWPASRGEQPSALNFDRLVNMAVARLIDISRSPLDPRHQRLRAILPVLARDEHGERQERVRMARTEAVQNTLRYALELFSRADMRSGFVGRPPATAGQAWERWHQYRLGTFAFGAYVAGEVGPSRGKRADQRLKEIGFIKRDQLRRKLLRPQGYEWVSDVSIVRVTRLFWAWLGMLDEWTRTLRGEARERGEARMRRVGGNKRPSAPGMPATKTVVAVAPPPVERSNRPPPLTDAEHAERLKAVRALLQGKETGEAQ